jgi:hypothetical protein
MLWLAVGALLTFQRVRAIEISNVVPRVDQHGNIVDAHEGNIFFFENAYWYFGVAYPPCTGACAACNASEACCTFDNNTLTLLSSPDLSHWTLVSTNLLPDSVAGKTVFLPSAAYSAATSTYALTWVEPGLRGALVATAPHPAGPWNVTSFLPLLLPPSSTIALWTDPATGTGYVRYNAAEGVPQPPMNTSGAPVPPSAAACNVTGYWYANCAATAASASGGGPWAWDFFGESWCLPSCCCTMGTPAVPRPCCGIRSMRCIHTWPIAPCFYAAAISEDASGGFGPGPQPNYWGRPWDTPLEMRGTVDVSAGTVSLASPTAATGVLQVWRQGAYPLRQPSCDPSTYPPAVSGCRTWRALMQPHRMGRTAGLLHVVPGPLVCRH